MSRTGASRPRPPDGVARGLARARLDDAERAVRNALDAFRGAQLDARTEAEDLGELASAGQHPADVASETFEREVQFGLLEETESALAEIAAARQRLADGTYGSCERCHAPIGDARLDALPATRWCRACADVDEHDRAFGLTTPRDRRGVLATAEFLATDDITGRERDVRAAEEAAITVRWVEPG